MSEKLKPETEVQLCDAIQWAVEQETAFDVVGAGSKHRLGKPALAGHTLYLSAFSGIKAYQPEELVMTVMASTPLEEIEAALSAHHQQLEFEPVDLEPLLNGTKSGNRPTSTIGGVIACNLSGPRRLKAGAARDHLLGFHAISGRGEVFKSGGQVVKNVTGFDLSKLMAGSFGTLAVMTEVSVKILPAPEKIRTVLVLGTGADQGIAALTAALHSPYEVSGAAHLPKAVAARSEVSYVSGAGQTITALRIEGVAPSVESRCESLKKLLVPFGGIEELHTSNSKTFWQEVRDVSFLTRSDRNGTQVWKLSVPPAVGAHVGRTILDQVEGELFYDWGGGLIWCAISPQDDAGQEIIRDALNRDGHATLIRADDDVRARVDVFQPQAKPLAALSARVKDAFDPKKALNPGRMYDGV